LNTEGESLRDTCDIFQCSKYSLVRWVRRYRQMPKLSTPYFTSGKFA